SAAVLAQRAGGCPTDSLEDCPHRNVGGIGRSFDGLRRCMLEQPVGEQSKRLAPVTPAACALLETDPYLKCPRGKLAARRHEGLDPPKLHAVKVNGQIKPAIGQVPRA